MEKRVYYRESHLHPLHRRIIGILGEEDFHHVMGFLENHDCVMDKDKLYEEYIAKDCLQTIIWAVIDNGTVSLKERGELGDINLYDQLTIKNAFNVRNFTWYPKDIYYEIETKNMLEYVGRLFNCDMPKWENTNLYFDIHKKEFKPFRKVVEGFNDIKTMTHLLYGAYIRIYEQTHEEALLKREDLVPNRHYMLLTGTNFRISPVLFRHTNVTPKKDCMGGFAKEVYMNSLDITSVPSYERKFMRVTNRSLLSRFRELKNEKLRVEAELAMRRRELFIERAKHDRIKKRDYFPRNQDTTTKLLSDSFADILEKAKKDNRIARSLLKMNALGHFQKVVRNITIRQSDKEMSYTPSGKPTILSDAGHWEAVGRQTGRYGKVIRRVLKEQVPRLKFKDSEIEDLVNLIKAEVSDGSFSIVSGEDIRYWYDEDNYEKDEDTDTLNNSCMRYSECSKYLDLYVENPDVVKMVILVKDDKLIGRALVWDDMWMDRIYGSNSTIKNFKNFAREKGYIHKYEQSINCQDGWIDPVTGRAFTEEVEFSLDNTDFDYYPYADTFSYIDVEGGMICNYQKEGYYSEIRDTEGGIEHRDRTWDDVDECYIDDEDAVETFRGGFLVITHYDNTTICHIDGDRYLTEECVNDHNGYLCYENNVEYVCSAGEYSNPDEVYTCEYDSDRYIESINPCVYVDDLEMYVCEDNVDDAYSENGWMKDGDGNWIEGGNKE